MGLLFILEVYTITKNIKGILLFTIIIIIFFNSGVTFAVQKVNWVNIQQENRKKLSRLESNDEIIMAKLNIAIALANQGKIVDSHKIFQEIEDITNRKDFLKLIQPFKEKLKKDPDNILYLNYTAFSHIIAEDYPSSITYLKKIIKLEEDNTSIINFLAASYIQIDNFEKARYYIHKAQNIEDNDFSSFLMGFIYYKQGNYFKSLNEFTRSGQLFKYYIID